MGIPMAIWGTVGFLTMFWMLVVLPRVLIRRKKDRDRE